MRRHIVSVWSGVVAVGFVFAVWLGLVLLPASMWFSVRNVNFTSVRAGASPAMVLDRDIKMPFLASWIVTIRRWDGGWVSFCAPSGTLAYKPDSRLPPNPDLHWWTWGQCHPLPPGRYEVGAHWRLHMPWFMPDKHVEVTSNVFEVRE